MFSSVGGSGLQRFGAVTFEPKSWPKNLALGKTSSRQFLSNTVLRLGFIFMVVMVVNFTDHITENS